MKSDDENRSLDPRPTTVTHWPCRKAADPTTAALIDVNDYVGISVGIEAVSKLLFKQDGTVRAVACRWGESEKLNPCPIFSLDDLKLYLETCGTDVPSATPTSHLFIIDQENTKACLDISHQGMNLLLSRVHAFPQLGYALTAFTAGDAPIFEGRNDFFATTSLLPASGDLRTEICMLLKYVELNNNESSPIPWSIREELFYQGVNVDMKREITLMIRPSGVFKRRFQEMFHPCSSYPSHWTNMVVLVISSLPAGWTEYTKFLDLAVWNTDISAAFTDPFQQSLGEANFKTLQATQTYHDLITRADHVLQGNISVLDQLAEETEKRRTLQKVININQDELLMTTIQEVKRQLQSARRHLSLIQARLGRITEAIRDSIALRSSHHTATESKNMHKLALQSNREARTVKAIALVTLIYLPATFVALRTFLGMNYIDVGTESSKGLLSASATSGLWLYAALTVPLTLATLLLWWAWEWWNRRRNEADFQKEAETSV